MLLILLFSLYAKAEIDVEEQIHREENPYYLDYLREKANDAEADVKSGIEARRNRIRDESAEEKARKEYVAWRDRQKVVNNDDEWIAKWEEFYRKKAEDEELQYLKEEREAADYRRKLQQKQLAHQRSIFENNRKIAAVSIVPPRVLKSKRKFFVTAEDLNSKKGIGLKVSDSVRPSPQLNNSVRPSPQLGNGVRPSPQRSKAH